MLEQAAEALLASRTWAPRLWLYTSFATSLSGGNPAGVVVSPEPIATQTAQSLAEVLAVPTTGFVHLDQAAAEGSASVRFFTPQHEIDACGHVTIAIATALVDCGIWSWGDDPAVRSAGSHVPLRLRDGSVEMEQRVQHLGVANVDWSDVANALGTRSPHSLLPLAIAGTGLRHLIVPLEDPNALSELTLARRQITALAEQAEADTICVWASTRDRNRFRVRDLCARIGAVEEPASGTTSGALALYLAQHGQLEGRELVIDQGVEMGRPSRIEVIVTAPDAVTIRGEALRILTGTLDTGLFAGQVARL
jgi:PhzF family phenazine biosynthesis protein